MNVDMLLAHLGQCTANLDVCVQLDGGAIDYDLTITEYPANEPTEIRISANGDTPKSQVDDVITDLEALTANLPVKARVGDGPWGDVLGIMVIPDEDEGTDVKIVSYYEDWQNE